MNFFSQAKNNDNNLLKFLAISNLLASCAEGRYKYAEDICQSIYTMDELVRYAYTDPILFFIYYTVSLVILVLNYVGGNHLHVFSIGLILIQKEIH